MVPGGCNICFNCCTVKFHFKNNKLVKITGNEEDPLLKGRVCPKSQLTLQMYHSEHRLLYPQKRVGARGEGRFERISWDQALDEIADKLKVIRDQYGAEALAMFIGTRTGILDYRATTKMFAQLFGTPNKDGTDPFCASGKNVARRLRVGVRIETEMAPLVIGNSSGRAGGISHMRGVPLAIRDGLLSRR